MSTLSQESQDHSIEDAEMIEEGSGASGSADSVEPEENNVDSGYEESGEDDTYEVGSEEGEYAEEYESSDEDSGEEDNLFSFSSTATVLVGLFRVKFKIHPGVVFKRSPVLAAALDKRWNPDNKPVELPEDYAETFNDYLTCVYTGSSIDSPHVCRHMRLYVLADKLSDLGTANLEMDYMMGPNNRGIPGVDIVQFAYDKAPESSPLRRYVAECWV